MQQNNCDIVHITASRIVPFKPKQLANMHDLFHLFPEQLRFTDEVEVGDKTQTMRFVKLKKGIECVICYVIPITYLSSYKYFPSVSSYCLTLA